MSIYEDIVKLEQMAQDQQAQGNYEQALQLHSQAIRLARQLDRPGLLAVLLNRLGRAYDLDGNPAKAGPAYENGLEALAGKKDLQLNAILAEKRTARKGYNAPVDEFPLPDLYSQTTADDLAEAEADPALQLRLLINSGNSYFQRHQDGAARKDYRLALEHSEMAQQPQLKAQVLTHLGLLHYRDDDPDTALAHLQQALALFETQADPLEKRRALGTLAHIYRYQGQTDLARRTYHEALDLYRQAGDTRGEARTLAGLGDLYLTEQDHTQAETTYRRAIALAEPHHDRATLWHASGGLGLCLRRQGQATQAIEYYERSLNLIDTHQQTLRTDEGRVSFLDSVQQIFADLLTIHLEQGNVAQALDVAEEARARALLALMGGRQRQRITGRAGVRTSRLRDFPDRQPDSPAQMAMGVSTSPMLDMRQMATGIEPQFQPLETDVEPPEAEPEIPQPPCLARLIYHVLPNHTAIFAVSPQGDIHHHLAPWGESQLTEQVKQLRRALQVDQQPRGVRGLFWAEEPQPETDYETILRKMYAILVEPLADHLPADGTPVAIEPHGPLWLLPFAALQTTNGTWLAEQWPLLYSPAAEVLDDIRRKPDYGTPADLRALIVGNPLMPSIPEYAGHKLELDPLPGAEQEAKAITDLFPAERVQLLRGSEATRTTIESVLVEYGILHLATHGLANADDPLASFIALAKSDQDDGLLTARRVLSRDIPADLVALSACQTGLGKISGDGMIGLSRAFLIAGARAVLVSQWSVSDEATVALMTAFYRHYINLDDKALALQQAMLEVKAVSEYAHPRFWAPFVIVGAEA